jgi:hypothetical protein
MSWVVDVSEPEDLEAGMPGFSRRFRFEGEPEARACAASAAAGGSGHEGFSVSCSEVRALRAPPAGREAAPGRTRPPTRGRTGGGRRAAERGEEL